MIFRLFFCYYLGLPLPTPVPKPQGLLGKQAIQVGYGSVHMFSRETSRRSNSELAY
ncbi:hypothetical protein PSAB6_330025 [Paraburkholderia sabiae]|nr:hypothetical protein PSAB6_330025 [Paraburkholderia sabiae]